MALDIYSTHYLLAAIKETTSPTTFLRDRYFPTNPVTDIFATNDVLVEYKDGNRKVAPFVAPRKGGVTMLRDGSTMERYTPPFVAPERMLTIDDIKKRGFGEALMSTLTPEQRAKVMVVGDMTDLDEMITRREEVMAAEVLFTNACVMKHYADDMTLAAENKVNYFDGSDNPAQYTPAVKWNESGAKIIDDLYAIAQMLTTRGLPASDLLVGPDVASVIINDANIQKLLDIKNYSLGEVDPTEGINGVSRLCVLNIYGKKISIFCYEETYEDIETGENKPYVPAGKVVMTAPAAGRTVYGAVTQLEQVDGEYHTYAEKRVPKYIANAETDTRKIRVASSPMCVPNHKNAWICATVL